VWGAIDEVVQVRDCDIYSYIPDMDADPFTDGNLWSFNYFFYNKSLQSTSSATSTALPPSGSVNKTAEALHGITGSAP
jgi:hypothetical protein